MEFRKIQVDAPRMTDVGNGRVVYAVPLSPLPEHQRLAMVHAPKEDPEAIEMVTLTIPRERVAKFAAWMAECGGSDREPTTGELNEIMKAAGTMLASIQIEVFSQLGDMFVSMLGDGDHDGALDRVAESFAARVARKAIAKGTSPEAASAEADAMRDALRTLIQRHRESEGGAA